MSPQNDAYRDRLRKAFDVKVATSLSQAAEFVVSGIDEVERPVLGHRLVLDSVLKS